VARSRSLRRQKHKKIREQTKGFKHARRRRIKAGREAALHAGQYAFIGRKRKKRDLKTLWILRLNAAARKHGLNYNQLINGLRKNEIKLDRKILAEIAVSDPETFEKIVSEIKKK